MKWPRSIAANGPALGWLLSADGMVLGSNVNAFIKASARAAKVVYGDRIEVCTGTGDIDKIKTVVSAVSVGQILLVGTFAWTATVTTDKITLASSQVLALAPGSVINFTGAASDRHVIDIDGSSTPVVGAQVIGPGTINVNNANDHAIRLQGDVSDCLIGDGLRLIHLGTEASVDEGIALAGDVDVRGNTFRKIYSSGWGAAGLEFGSNAHDNVAQDCHFVGCQDAVQFAGRTKAPTSVKFYDGTTYRTLTNAFDGSAATSVDVDDTAGAGGTGLRTTDEFLIGLAGKAKSIYVDMAAAVQTNAARLSLSVSNGAGSWTSVRLVRDETADSSGAPFAQDGEIEWEHPESADWDSTTIDGVAAYWLRIQTSANLSTFDVNEIYGREFPFANVIENNVIEGSTQKGVRLEDGRYNVIRGNRIRDNTQDGVYIAHTNALKGAPLNNRVESNQISGNGNTGVKLESDVGTGHGAKGTQVLNNSIWGNAQHGITFSDTVAGDVAIRGNDISHNTRGGIGVRGNRHQITGNQIRNNGQGRAGETDANRAGVRVISGSNNVIAYNAITDDQTEATQTWAVDIATGTSNRVIENVLSGNTKDPQAQDAGTLTVFERNVGYVTENYGSATISGNGVATAFAVAHGLAVTPVFYSVTPTTAAAIGDFRATADATNITVTYGSAPASGTNNVSWVWRAQR